MVGAGGHVGGNGGQGVAVAIPLLNAQTAQGVGVVAGPDLGEVAQNAQVEAIAPGGAALEQNVREPGGEGIHQPIQAQDIPVGGFALAFRGQIRGVDV